MPTENKYKIDLITWGRMSGYATAEDMDEALCLNEASEGTSPALCTEGCIVEPDGECAHGCISAMRAAGLV